MTRFLKRKEGFDREKAVLCVPKIEDIGMECELTKDWGTFRHESIMVMRLVDDEIEIGKYDRTRSVSGLVFCSRGLPASNLVNLHRS